VREDADDSPWDFSNPSNWDRGAPGRDDTVRSADDRFGDVEREPATPGWADPGDTGHGMVVSSPYGWVLAAAGCAALSVVIGLMAQGRPGVATIGWLIGGAGSIGLLTVFTIRDGGLRADSWYVSKHWPEQVRTVVAAVAAIGVGLNAWWFADSISRTIGS
jgi:hypothetical protein